MQADAVISFPLFKHKPMPCHVYISLSKRRPKAPKRSHSSLEVYPSLKSLAQSLRGVAAISSCVADLLHGLWHIAEGPPKRVVSSQAAAAQSSHTEKPCRATCSELSSAGTGQIVASDVSARYLGISAWPCRLSCQTGLCLICTSDCNSTVENAHVWRWFCSSLCYQPSAVLTKLADWLCWELNNNNLAKKKRKKKKEFWFQTSFLSEFTGDPHRQLRWHNWRGAVPAWAAAGCKTNRRSWYLHCWFSYSLRSPSSAVAVLAFDIMSYSSINHRNILEAGQTREELGGKYTFKTFFVSLMYSCYQEYCI